MSSGDIPTAISIGTNIGANIAHFDKAEVINKFNIAVSKVMPTIVILGDIFNDFKNSAPDMAINVPTLELPKTYKN